MRKRQTQFYSGPASRRSSPCNRPLEEQFDNCPGSVPCSTGPSNIYSCHKPLPTASLTAVGTAKGRAETACSYIKCKAFNLRVLLCIKKKSKSAFVN